MNRTGLYLRFRLVILSFSFILWSAITMYGQEIRLGFTNLLIYQRKVEVFSDSIDFKITPFLEQKDGFFRFTFEYLIKRKQDSNKLVFGIGLIRSNIHSQQIVPRRDSLIRTSVNERIYNEIIFLIGKEKVISITDKLNLDIGLCLRTQLKYIDKSISSRTYTTKKGNILLGSKSILEYNNSFSIGPSTSINLNYSFWKRLRFGIQINTWLYFSKGLGDFIIESWDYGKNNEILRYIPYKHEIDAWNISTSNRFSITLSYNFCLGKKY